MNEVDHGIKWIGRESVFRYVGYTVLSEENFPLFGRKTDAEAITVVISDGAVKLLSAVHGYSNRGMGVDQGF